MCVIKEFETFFEAEGGSRIKQKDIKKNEDMSIPARANWKPLEQTQIVYRNFLAAEAYQVMLQLDSKLD